RSERKASKLSEVRQRWATSSASDCSTREGSRPVLRVSSPKKSAPSRVSVSRTSAVSGEKSVISEEERTASPLTPALSPLRGEGEWAASLPHCGAGTRSGVRAFPSWQSCSQWGKVSRRKREMGVDLIGAEGRDFWF